MAAMALIPEPIWNFFSFLIPFLVVLTIVVFIHEMGHFLVARWCGVAVKAFSIGFGKEIYAWEDSKGTRWRLAWIPLGGYVKFMDDANGASMPSQEAIKQMSPEERAGSFHAKPLWAKAAVVAAGPIANFLLTIVIFTGLFYFIGVREAAPRVDIVTPGQVAEKAGFKTGDMILEINGEKIPTFNALQRVVSVSFDRELTFKVKRGERILTLKATPQRREIKNRFGDTMKMGLIGIQRSNDATQWVQKSFSPVEALWKGSTETMYIVTRTVGYVRDVIVGREDADQLGGPIRIAKVSGQAASLGIVALIHLMAVLSVSVGILNLLPIPMLDGGHLLFYAIEAVRRRPMSERSQEIGFRIGIALVLMLMLFATYNDIPIVVGWFTG
ncbi:MAG: RIP metalloprotease RseP [Pseudomonadota bacterium]